jgi:shikimate kinase
MTGAGKNVVLVGMPGVGKSTLGVLLAKCTGRDFVDTDVRIQASVGRTLQDVIDRDGVAAFRRIEERAILDLQCRNTVISTGGSVVYSSAAITHLRTLGPIIHLDLPLPLLRQRLDDLGSRGVVMSPGQTLEELYAERAPLYRLAADIRVDCSGMGHEAAVQAILAALAGEREWRLR